MKNYIQVFLGGSLSTTSVLAVAAIIDNDKVTLLDNFLWLLSVFSAAIALTFYPVLGQKRSCALFCVTFLGFAAYSAIDADYFWAVVFALLFAHEFWQFREAPIK